MPNKDFHPVHLALQETQTQLLQEQYQQLQQQLERGLPLQPTLFSDLQSSMQNILQQQTDFPDINLFTPAQHHIIHLMHEDNFILNLPWRLAVENRDRIYLTKGLLKTEEIAEYQAVNPLPLKILVMIASPEDSDIQHRLSWEKEEDQIIRAFEQLYENAEVQIDFTADGSLESLEKKLKENHYHILHFSGHGVFKDGKGYLALENFITMKQQLVDAETFAKSINVQPLHRPAIILLSSCQTAQGTTQEGFKGVTNQLLTAGVPAVIAMGFSILDYFATEFAAKFYQELAQKIKVEQAFAIAIRYILILENQLREGQPVQAAQWMIPQLYLNEKVSDLVPWNATKKTLKFKAIKLVTGENRMLLGTREKHYQFLGRRKERKILFQKILDKEPILLKGQGGVGKTSMAEHLVERLIAKNSKTYPFAFNEITTWQDIIDALQGFFKSARGGGKLMIASEVRKNTETAAEQLEYLLSLLFQTPNCEPVFIFDNVETFQQGVGGQAFKLDAQDILLAIKTLRQSAIFPLILTGRYPLVEFPDLYAEDLNQVGFNDFYKKCQQLNLRELQWKLHRKDFQLPVWEKTTKNATSTHSERPTFKAIVQILHKSFGGNYRTLEFFDKLYIQKKKTIHQTLGKLVDFQNQIQTDKAAVLQEVSEDLVFTELLELLTPEEMETLGLLTNFRVPVLLNALEMQNPDKPFSKALTRLVNTTLIEVHKKGNTEQFFYYVTPIVRDLLAQNDLKPYSFSHEKAGRYFDYIIEEQEGTIGEMEEAFYHYLVAENSEKVNDLGSKITVYYYDRQLFRNAYYYGINTENFLKKDVNWLTLNCLGLINKIQGELDIALSYFEKNLKKLRPEKKRLEESIVMNNISQVYFVKGKYNIALEYLNNSMTICIEIGDKNGEAVALCNIGELFNSLGKYDLALDYFDKSLLIHQEIGNKVGANTTMHNFATTHYYKGNFEKALEYLEISLKISRQSGDRTGECATLNSIGGIHKQRGDFDLAMSCVTKALSIAQELGVKKEEGVSYSNMSQIFKQKGDYSNALNYLKKGLSILGNIGDKVGECAALNNISQVFQAQGKYEDAMIYLKKSLKISKKIGHKESEAVALNNISQVHQSNGNYELAEKNLLLSLKIRKNIGDKHGEANNLNNLGTLAYDRAEYTVALDYFERSYEIFKKMGSKKLLPTIHNIAQIYLKHKNIDKFLEYELSAYQIANENQDATAIYQIGKNIGEFLCYTGRIEEGLPMLKQSYAIARRANFPKLNQLAALIQKYEST